MTSVRVASLVGVLISFVPLGVWAQEPRWGTSAVPRSGVCFYRDAFFRGEYFCARTGENIPVVPDGMNDQISSIRVFGNADVTIYRNGRFRGESARFLNDVQNLKSQGWNEADGRAEDGRPAGEPTPECRAKAPASFRMRIIAADRSACRVAGAMPRCQTASTTASRPCACSAPRS